MKTPSQLFGALAKFRKLSLRNTLYLQSRRQDRDVNIYVGRSVYCYSHPSSKITGSGVCYLGATWEHSRTFPSELRMLPNSRLHIQEESHIVTGFRISLQANATLTLGSGYINSGVRIDCWKSISLGKEVAIGPDVTICDGDSHYLSLGEDSGVSGNPDTPIVLEDHVWVGARAIILKGVTIGAGSVIAAGSVVVKDIPPGCLAAGVPAKVIRQGIRWR